MQTEKILTTTLRLPAEIAKALRHKAVDNYRSFNAEVLHRLTGSLREEEQAHDSAQA